MESQPQNPEFRINPENFHPCPMNFSIKFDIVMSIWSIVHIDGSQAIISKTYCTSFSEDPFCLNNAAEMQHFIWVFTVCKNTRLWVSSLQRVKECPRVSWECTKILFQLSYYKRVSTLDWVDLCLVYKTQTFIFLLFFLLTLHVLMHFKTNKQSSSKNS